MHAASRAVLLVAFAGTAACTGTVPAQNAGMGSRLELLDGAGTQTLVCEAVDLE